MENTGLNTEKIYKHFKGNEDREKIKSGEYERVDFVIGVENDIENITKNLAGFGIDQSQRIIIEFDKGYGCFMVKRIPMKYGASTDTPQ